MKRMIAVLLMLVIVCPTWAQLTDATLGKPNSVTLSGSDNTVGISQTTTANDVDTDVITTGIIGSATKAVGNVAVAIGTLTTGTKFVEITPSGAAVFGGAGIATGAGSILPAATTKTYKTSTADWSGVYILLNGTGTVHINHLK